MKAKVRIVFNCGLLSTQAMNRGSNAALRQMIGTTGNKVRKHLTTEPLSTLQDLLKHAQPEGGTCYAALYELTDEEIIADLERTAGMELVLSNARYGGDSHLLWRGKTAGCPSHPLVSAVQQRKLGRSSPRPRTSSDNYNNTSKQETHNGNPTHRYVQCRELW